MVKFKLTLLLGIFAVLGGFSQQFEKLPNAQNGTPLFLVNNNIIVNVSFIKQLDLKKITHLSVYKDTDKARKKVPYLSNLLANGIISVFTKERFAYTSLQELQKKHKLDSNTCFYVNGYKIEDLNLKVASCSTIETQIIEPSTKNNLLTKALNICTVKSENQKQLRHCNLLKPTP